MNDKEFQQFLTEPKEYREKTCSNAQFIAREKILLAFRDSTIKTEALTTEQEQFYTNLILGEFIKSNPKGNYRLPEEEKKALSLLEQTLKTEYGLSDKQVKSYWKYLMYERAKLENHYMDKIDTFYHLSHIPPDKLHPCQGTGKIGIDLKECLDAYHQMNGLFCYVAPKGVVPMCLRSTEMKMYPYLNPSFVVVATKGKDFESSCLTCYEYEVERSKSIRPVVMPWGDEPVEYISTQPLKIMNLDNPKIQTPRTLVEDGLKIYLIDDLEFYKKQTQSPMVNALPIKEQEKYFEELIKKYPDKVKRYEPKSEKSKEKPSKALLDKLAHQGNC